MRYFLLKLSISLAIKDLRHDWFSSACVVASVFAALAPLLFLDALSIGAMEAASRELLDNPANLQIRPLSIPTGIKLDKEWFTRLSQRPECGFVIPQVSFGTSSSLMIKREGAPDAGEPLILDMWPTKAGDPYFERFDLAAPGDGQCGLTKDAAEKLGVVAGERIRVVATRVSARQSEASLTLEVSSVLQKRKPGFPVLFLPLTIAEKFEDFKEGKAVPDLGWSGDDTSRAVAPVFQKLYVATTQELRERDLSLLAVAGRFANHAVVSPESPGWPSLWKPTGRKLFFYRFDTAHNPLTVENLNRFVAEMKDADSSHILPWSEGGEIEISQEGVVLSSRLECLPDTLPAAKYFGLGSAAVKAGLTESSTWKDPSQRGAIPKMVISSGTELRADTATICRVRLSDRDDLIFPVDLATDADVPKSAVLASPPVVSIVAQARAGARLRFEPTNREFLHERRTHRGFRLFAKELEGERGVGSLKDYLEDQGIDVATAASRIDDALQLSRMLKHIFWGMVIVTFVGAVITLSAVQIIAVERKKRDLAVLRMLGFPRFAVTVMPLWQAFFLSIMAAVLACGVLFAYSLAAKYFGWMNLGFGEPPGSLWHILCICSGGVLLVFFVTGVVAWQRVFGIAPSDALKD